MTQTVAPPLWIIAGLALDSSSRADNFSKNSPQ